MKNVIPKDTRYVPITQQPACCVPASISVVMLKLGIPLISQELLGYHLGLRVNRKVKSLFWNARTGLKPGAGYGTQMMKKEYNENSAFKKLKIPLKSTHYPIENFKSKEEVVKFIYNRINKNSDLIVFLRSGVLNDNIKKNGHACVIDRIYPKKDTIRLIDPAAKQAKWREFKIDKFIKAMKLHPTHEGRLMELRKIK
ncbi:MAG: hypothetical protein ACREGC_03090 [Minisyncoccia bacterium]